MEPMIFEVEVALGETKVINGSFQLPTSGKIPIAGLNRYLVSLYHHLNENNDEASLILQKEGIFCPPEMIEQ